MKQNRMVTAVLMVGMLGLVGCGDAGSGPAAPLTGGSWERLPEPPLSPREGTLGLWSGSEVLLVGGSDAPPCPPAADCVTPRIPALGDGAALDPATQTWRRIAPAPTPVLGAEGVVIGDTVYVWVPGDSRRPGLERAFLAYHLRQDRWEELPVPTTAEDHGYLMEAFADRLVLYRVSDEYGESPDLVFDPQTAGWTELPDDSLPRSYDRALAWSGEELVLIAKRIVPDPGAYEPNFVSAAAFDPAPGEWRGLPDSQVLDMGLTGCWIEVDGKLVNPSVGAGEGGGDWDGTYPDGGVLDPESGEWSDLPEAPEGSAEFEYGGGIFTASGGRCLSTNGFALDAGTMRWVEIKPLDDHYDDDQTVVGTQDGILAFGGPDWDGPDDEGKLLNAAWLWAPR